MLPRKALAQQNEKANYIHSQMTKTGCFLSFLQVEGQLSPVSPAGFQAKTFDWLAMWGFTCFCVLRVDT